MCAHSTLMYLFLSSFGWFIPLNRYYDGMYEIWNIMVQLFFKILFSFLAPIGVLILTVSITDYVTFSQIDENGQVTVTPFCWCFII